MPISQSEVPQIFSPATPTTNDTFSFDGTLWVPKTIANLRSDLGIGRKEITVFYNNANFTWPSWMGDNDTIEICTCGGGGSGGSGGAIVTTTIGASGGTGGTGAAFNRTVFTVGQLKALGTSLAIVIGLGGAAVAGVSGAGVGLPGNNGLPGSSTTVTCGSTLVNRATGGLGGNKGINSATAAAGVANTLPLSGIVGGGSPASSSSGNPGSPGGTSTQESPGAGASAGGLSAGNAASAGAPGGVGAVNVRSVTEPQTPAGSNAVAQFVPGSTPQIPYPGNGGGSSAGSIGNSLVGGDGVNGGGGGGSGAARVLSGASGKGGNGFCYIICSGTNATAQIRTQIIPGGRLTLSPTLPNPTTDITNATTLFYLPYLHNQIQLFDNVDWINLTFTAVSISLSGLAIGVYDVFAFNNAGTVALELSAWANNTTRALAINQRDGVWVRTNDNTRRLLGTIYINAIGTSQDTKAQRFISNLYNRTLRSIGKIESANFWTATAFGIIEPWGNRAGATTAGLANRFECVNVLDTDPLSMIFSSRLQPASGNGMQMGIGHDSISAYGGGIVPYTTLVADVPYYATLNKLLGIGYHYAQCLQINYFANTGNFISNGGAGYEGTWTA